jgi:hypothetical protein
VPHVIQSVGAVAAHREPSQTEGQDLKEDEAGEECRRAHPDEGETHRERVGHRVPSQRRDDPQRHSEEELEQEGHAPEEHGAWQAGEDDLEDRFFITERAAQITTDHVGEVVEVLDDEGPIEAVSLAVLLDLLGPGVRPERRHGGVSDEVGDHEDQRHRRPDDEEGAAETRQDAGAEAHRSAQASALAPRRGPRSTSAMRRRGRSSQRSR